MGRKGGVGFWILIILILIVLFWFYKNPGSVSFEKFIPQSCDNNPLDANCFCFGKAKMAFIENSTVHYKCEPGGG